VSTEHWFKHTNLRYFCCICSKSFASKKNRKKHEDKCAGPTNRSTVILNDDQSKNSKSPLYKNITDTTEGLSTQARTESKSLAMDINNISAPCYYCKTCENCGMKFASKDMKTSTHRYHTHKERCDRQNISNLKLPDSAFVIIEERGKIYYQCNFKGCLASNEL
jgi:hypothetical protein